MSVLGIGQTSISLMHSTSRCVSRQPTASRSRVATDGIRDAQDCDSLFLASSFLTRSSPCMAPTTNEVFCTGGSA